MKAILRNTHILISALAILAVVSCSKSVDQPANNAAAMEIAGFHISESRVVLLQGNAKNRAIAFNWAPGAAGDTYTLEADVTENYFADPLEIATVQSNNIAFTTEEFNTHMSKLIFTDNSGRVDFRVKLTRGHNTIYSSVTALDVSTYRNYISYDGDDIIKVPGNYQGWNVASAPKIVTTQKAGEYEGYLNLQNPSPQVLLVKGNDNQWGPRNTYSYIGNDMFGFGGSIMFVSGGAGIYLFRANTNTNKWSAVKINTWNIAGNAATQSSKTVLTPGDDLTWSVTTDLAAGSFRINANNGNAISFGHKAGDQPGVPSYEGDDLKVKRAGNYTITLKLTNAGNYAYTVRKN